MAERRIRYGWLWLVFVAALLAGAVLVSGADSSRRWFGLGLIVTPALVLGLLTLAYYFVERRRAKPPSVP
jgi:drug/metabolite transporter (DMT)-like permease